MQAYDPKHFCCQVVLCPNEGPQIILGVFTTPEEAEENAGMLETNMREHGGWSGQIVMQFLPKND